MTESIYARFCMLLALLYLILSNKSQQMPMAFTAEEVPVVPRARDTMSLSVADASSFLLLF